MGLNSLFYIEELTGLSVINYSSVILRDEEGRRQYGTMVKLENEMLAILIENSDTSVYFYTFKFKDLFNKKAEPTKSKKYMRTKNKYDKDWDILIPINFYEKLKDNKKTEGKVIH